MKKSAGSALVIAGRPNVGKSSLFNKIVRRRVAIVHEESGVTRDRVVCNAEWEGRRFRVIDTGGISNPDRSTVAGTIDSGVRAQVDLALADAAVVILVVDVQSGLMPLDEEAAAVLRKSGLPVLLAANKSDNPELDQAAAEFQKFGFPVFPVSVVHSKGIETLLDAAIKHLPVRGGEPMRDATRVAVIGRPNVGKSSFINRLLREDRMIVSDIPGTTRDSVEMPFSTGTGDDARHYLLVDTAGIRKPGRIDTAVEQFSVMRAEQSIKKADMVVLMIDAAQGITEGDKKVASRILLNRKACIVVVTKWDLSEVSEKQWRENNMWTFSMLDYAPVLFVSSLTGENVDKTLAMIDRVSAFADSALSTPALNRAISGACERVAPPQVHGKRLKIYYAAQTGSRPITIQLFVNNPDHIQPSYKSYLIRSLRETFGLDGAPVILRFKSSEKTPGTVSDTPVDPVRHPKERTNRRPAPRRSHRR